MGKTIFFSSHILADVAEICTHIGIVEAGQIVAQGTMDEMQRVISARAFSPRLLASATMA